MIVYSKELANFIQDVELDSIGDIISGEVVSKLGIKVSESEVMSWNNSLPVLAQVLRDPELPAGIKVSLEYSIPRTRNRVDAIVTGSSIDGKPVAILIELKQWTDAEPTSLDGVVRAKFRGKLQNTLHPSYQVWSYKGLLEGFNKFVQSEAVDLYACAFLHNCSNDSGYLTDQFYSAYTSQAPVFFKHDKRDFRAYLKQLLANGDTVNILESIDTSEQAPSKTLADSLKSMLRGNKEFVLIDSQKEVFEQAKYLYGVTTSTRKKQVLLVKGGPGTGKSVVAINLLSHFTKRGQLAAYVTKNSAPREVYHHKLTGSVTKGLISQMFRGSDTYCLQPENANDVLLVDESHRLIEKARYQAKVGENQIKEIINAAWLSVFFLDEDQRVTLNDIGSEEQIRYWADALNADLTVTELESQFRCSGADGYLPWLDNALGIRDTANQLLKKDEYFFRVLDNPNELKDRIIQHNDSGDISRIVAGYCWKWISKSGTKSWNAMSLEERENTYDIVFPEFDFAMRWNLVDQGQAWLIHPESINEIGCIHTCQGLEVDYIGVIIGDDFLVRNGEIQLNPAAHPGMDKALQGWKALLENDPTDGQARIDSVIRNTYRTLMSRGMKGCYIFSGDPETRNYFKSLLER